MGPKAIEKLQATGMKQAESKRRQISRERAAEEARLAREQAGEARRDRRIETYSALASLNRELSEWSDRFIRRTLAACGKDPDSHTDSPWMVLKRGDRDDNWVAGFVSKSEWKNRQPVSWHRYDFKVFVANSDDIEKMRETPIPLTIDPLAKHDETFYWVSEADSSEDEIMVQARLRSTTRAIEPVKALKRVLYLEGVRAGMVEARNTAILFMEAAREQDLNSHIAPGLQLQAEDQFPGPIPGVK